MIAPKAAAEPDQHIDNPIDITRTLNKKEPTWDEIVTAQIARRDQQIKQQQEEETRRQKEEQERQAQAQQTAVQSQPAQPAPLVQGGKTAWLIAAGIPQDQWAYVDSIVSRESGWNPNAVNASSGACGLGQQLPCGKWAGAWNDPVAALIAMTGYVTARYGGWAGAYSFWNANHWY